MINKNSSWLISSALLLVLMQGCSLKESVKPTESELSINHTPDAPAIIATPDSQYTEAVSIIENGQIFSSGDIDSWDYIISLYAIPEVNNPRIEREIKRFLKHPEYFAKLQARAEPYLYNIIQEVEKKGLPGELALLPAIESAFKAHAYSHSSAAGLWQFIPATGRLYGLHQNWWYDGRRDVYSSTDAATSYLLKLGRMFDDDWLLALASYNAGMGTVGKAVKRNKARNLPTDYWSLKLPKETMNYVPRLLALAKIFANAEHYGIHLRKQAYTPMFEPVDIGSQISLTKAAELSGITIDELFSLNPGFSRSHTPPQGPHRLLIPVAQVDEFRTNLAMLPDAERVQWHRHKVKSGENIGSIARHYKTSAKIVREVNHLPNNNIRAGSYLMVPGANIAGDKNPFLQANALNPKRRYRSYKVRKGDSLWSIGRKFGVSSRDLARWNRISTRSTLRLGQKLVVRKGRSYSARTSTAKSANYTVRSGDSLYTISKKFNVQVADLRRWNSSKLGKYLRPGQKLKVKG
ncbi:MAG: LysM peptidoglycan-binding domain-containing protein [Methyloprofundus sp.]|nr:LysM peptidoglycan-binding domain-containing protein [Methyloprofundus sp.]